MMLKTFLLAIILFSSYDYGMAQGTCSTGRTGNGGAYNINSAFGARYWNCYALRGRNIGSPQNLEYRGFFTLNTLGINQNYGSCSPNQAVGYTPCSGCNDAVGDANNNADRFTVVYKRQGFPCGKYTIQYAVHDDNGNIFLNGNQIYSNTTCCGPGGVLGPYDLDGNSTIEIRFGEEGGGAHAAVNIIPHGISGGTITGPVNACVGNQITLSNVIDGTVSAGYGLTYKWYRYNPNTAAWEFIIDNGPASLTENAPTQTGAYTYLRRSYIKCVDYESECFEYACYDATFVVNVGNTYPTAGTVTVNGSNSGTVDVCQGQTISVSQSGWNNLGGTTYFYADNTDGVGGWAVGPPFWEIMDYGNIAPANQVGGQTGVNNLSSFNFKINTPGIHILHTNAFAPSGCYTATGGVNRYINVKGVIPGEIGLSSSGICNGNSITINSNTDATIIGASDLEFQWWRESPPGSGNWSNFTTNTSQSITDNPGTGTHRYLRRAYSSSCGPCANGICNDAYSGTLTVYGVPTNGTLSIEGSSATNVTACWGQTIDLAHTGWNNAGGETRYYVGTRNNPNDPEPNWITNWDVLNAANANQNSASYNSGLYSPGEYVVHVNGQNGICWGAGITRFLTIVGANGGTIALAQNSICSGSDITINSTTNATLHGASDLTFDWFRESPPGSGNWTTLATNINNQNYTEINPPVGTHRYLRRAYSAACGAGTNSQFREDALTGTLTVSEATNPGTISGVPAQICEGSNVVYTANIVSGTFQQFEYQWNATDPNGWTTTWGGTNSFTWNACCPGNTLNVRARVQSGACSVEYTSVVSTFVNPLPVLAANTGGTTFSSGSISLLENSTLGGTWSSSNSSTVVINNPAQGLITGATPGTATITYTFTNGFGCASSTSTSVTVVPVTFVSTGADQTYTVPSGVTKIRVKMWGAGGGGGQSGGPGGGGAFVEGDLCVTPGEVLTLIVGGGGLGGNGSQWGNNAYGGGGASPDKGLDAGGGGGRTAIRRNSSGVEIAIAGAGGGGAGGTNKRGGAAGGVGANGETGLGGEGGQGGQSNGTGGNNYSRTPSISGGSWNGVVGGNGGNGEQCCSNRAGGGGGSGFGGGSGGLSGDNNSGAGGGGSSYFSGTLTATASGSGQEAGQWANADNGNAYGGGGNAATNGQPGRIVISVAEITTAGVLSVSAPGYTGGATIEVCPGTQITFTRGGGSGTANYWAGDETNALEVWGYFDNQQYGNSFNYTFNNPGFYLIRTHPSNTCGYNWAEASDVRVFVRPVDAKAIAGDQTICLSAIPPAALTGGTPDNGAGAYTFNWQQSIDNGVTWTDAPGIRTNATYNAGNINSETLFKRQVTSRGCVTTEGELVNWAWTSNNVWTVNSSIKKFNTVADDWDAGAISSQSITNNGGYVEATIFKDGAGAQMIGLGNYDTDPSYTSIEFAAYAVNGLVQVYESGSYRGDFGTYVRGDVFRVAVENNHVNYYKNGTLFYTSIVMPTFPLYADAAVYSGGTGAPSWTANGAYGISSGFKFVRIFNPIKVEVSDFNFVVVNSLTSCLPQTVDLTDANITQGSSSGLTYTYWSDANATVPASYPSFINVSGNYYIKATNIFNCFKISPPITVSVGPDLAIINNIVSPSISTGDYLWTGIDGPDWNNPSNWFVSNGTYFTPALSVPANSINTFILPLSLTQNCISSNEASIASNTQSGDTKDITIWTDANFHTKGTLNVYGNFKNLGTASGHTIAFNGSDNQTFQTGMGTTATPVASKAFKFLVTANNSANNYISFVDNGYIINKIIAEGGSLRVPVVATVHSRRAEVNEDEIDVAGELRLNDCNTPIGTIGSISGSNFSNLQREVPYTFSIPAVSNAALYTWNFPSGFIINSGQGTPSVTVTLGCAAFGGDIEVIAENICGAASTSESVTTASSLPQPDATTGPAGPLACGTTHTYSTNPVTGATDYTWSVPSGFIILSGQGTTSIDVLVMLSAQNGNVSVGASAACGQVSPTRTLAVTVIPIPATPGAISGSNTNLCTNSSYTFSIGSVNHATSYHWNVPSGWNITSNNGTSITVTSGTSGGTISVSASNSCGTSGLSSINVSMLPAPTQPGAISGCTLMAYNALGITYSISPVANATSYNWLVPSGADIVVNTGTSITVNYSGTMGVANSGNISVSAVNCNGTSTPRTLAVTFGGKQIFNYTGSDQNWTASPCGISEIQVKLWGAGGGGGYGGGTKGSGAGAFVRGNLSISHNEVFTLIVGKGGGVGIANAGVYGYGGGAPTFLNTSGWSNVNCGGQGGGRTALRRNGVEIAIAGSGGGAGSGYNNANGGGGGASGIVNGTTGIAGGNGQVSSGSCPTEGGLANGTGGSGSNGSGNGVSWNGSAGGNGGYGEQVGGSNNNGGGGGGSGYGGGAGGCRGSGNSAGGSGGSSYMNGFTNVYGESGLNGSNATPSAGGTTDSDYATGIGSGWRGSGTPSAGGHGRAVILY